MIENSSIGILRVVVPLYKDALNDNEILALKSMYELLVDKYPITILAPIGVEFKTVLRHFPKMGIRRLAAENFISVESYNKMMLQHEVYDLFADSEYIIIYQTDCYLFEDRVAEFVKLGFDYIGAPWIPKPKYEKWYYKAWIQIQKTACKLLKKRLLRHNINYQVGNGGFCLRRIEAMQLAIQNHGPDIEKWLLQKSKFIYEDVFFALLVPELKVAPFEIGLEFGFDTRPEIAYKLNNYRLPMGCHAWERDNMWLFWKNHIKKR